jgi:hypothetical protein
MNRIEQVATPAPAQQPNPRRRLPQGLADVRRLAAHTMLRRDVPAARSRRGATGLAMAIAALSVPMLSCPAFGATSSAALVPVTGHSNGTKPDTGHTAAHRAGTRPDAVQPTAHARHHLDHDLVFPGPGAVTVEAWSTTGWALNVPNRPADLALLGHVLVPEHHPYAWPAESQQTMHVPRPVAMADGGLPEIEAYHVSHTSPRLADPDPDGSGPQTPADQYSDGMGPNNSTETAPANESSPDQLSNASMNMRSARSRITPAPLIPISLIPPPRPANTKQMFVTAGHQATAPAKVYGPKAPAAWSALTIKPASAPKPSLATRQAVAVPATSQASPASPCLRTAYLAGKDRHMQAHLRSAADAMNIVRARPHSACAAMVDYLSQARA